MQTPASNKQTNPERRQNSIFQNKNLSLQEAKYEERSPKL